MTIKNHLFIALTSIFIFGQCAKTDESIVTPTVPEEQEPFVVSYESISKKFELSDIELKNVTNILSIEFTNNAQGGKYIIIRKDNSIQVGTYEINQDNHLILAGFAELTIIQIFQDFEFSINTGTHIYTAKATESEDNNGSTEGKYGFINKEWSVEYKVDHQAVITEDYRNEPNNAVYVTFTNSGHLLLDELSNGVQADTYNMFWKWFDQTNDIICIEENEDELITNCNNEHYQTKFITMNEDELVIKFDYKDDDQHEIWYCVRKQ